MLNYQRVIYLLSYCSSWPNRWSAFSSAAFPKTPTMSCCLATASTFQRRSSCPSVEVPKPRARGSGSSRRERPAEGLHNERNQYVSIILLLIYIVVDIIDTYTVVEFMPQPFYVTLILLIQQERWYIPYVSIYIYMYFLSAIWPIWTTWFVGFRKYIERLYYPTRMVIKPEKWHGTCLLCISTNHLLQICRVPSIPQKLARNSWQNPRVHQIFYNYIL